MDRDLVIVVPSETAANDALRALQRLDDEGSIELYSAAVVTKQSDGQLKILDRKDSLIGAGTLLGMSTGALVGLLAGPVGAAAGAAVTGAAALGAGGLIGDLAYSGFSGDFIRRAGERLTPGKSAV